MFVIQRATAMLIVLKIMYLFKFHLIFWQQKIFQLWIMFQMFLKENDVSAVW